MTDIVVVHSEADLRTVHEYRRLVHTEPPRVVTAGWRERYCVGRHVPGRVNDDGTSQQQLHQDSVVCGRHKSHACTHLGSGGRPRLAQGTTALVTYIQCSHASWTTWIWNVTGMNQFLNVVESGKLE